MEVSDPIYTPATLSPGKDPGIDRIGSWMGPAVSLDVLKRKTSRPIPGVTNNNREKENLKARDHLGDLDIGGGNKMGLKQCMRT